MGKLIAEHIAQKTNLPMFDRWNLRRFKEGKLLSEGMILG
jgi:sarcosine oxidase subunit beta